VKTGGGRWRAPAARARRAELRESVLLLRLEDACEHGLGFINVAVWRRSRPVEDGGAPGVDGHADRGQQPEHSVEDAAGQGQEQDQIRRVVEREAEAELLPAVVLV